MTIWLELPSLIFESDTDILQATTDCRINLQKYKHDYTDRFQLTYIQPVYSNKLQLQKELTEKKFNLYTIGQPDDRFRNAK
jgi:hypothetical protein